MKSNLIENRQIRVFISSTFQDMQDERDYLMKHTFPSLRKLAASRDVTLTELDLRWGITEEEAKSGKVVEICLQEIDNCIPFFIGIIGNRYGWVPERKDISERVTDLFQDVNNYLEHHLSVTEMEMQFGVLQRKENVHAYFYIKDETETADNPEMLERLKKEVRASKYPTSQYSTPEDLASQVEKAFVSLLDEIFPVGNLSELEKERIGQRAFMNQLCLNYIRGDRNFKALDDWLHDADARQLVVTGASGLGKSALIANWLKEKLTNPNRDYNIIYHFTGNGGSESNHELISGFLADEINDVYGWEDNEDVMNVRMEKGDNMSSGMDKKDDKLNDLFIKVASEGNMPLLIVLDAINQIIDTDNAKLLNWLPVPPRKVKILFSTLEDDRTMEVFRNRNYPLFTLQPLDISQRRELVNSYLHDIFAKKLSTEQVERIVTDRQCENPLVMKTLLDELVNFGIYEKLDEKIDYYLSKDTIEGFYQAVIQSYEEEFGTMLVKKFLSLMALSKKGMSEEELIAISKTRPLYWSQFYHLFISHLVTKNGLVAFSHDHIRHAVENRYVKDAEWEKQCRRDIMAYFEDNNNIESVRSYEELAFQYYKLEEYDSLYHLLLTMPVFKFLYQHHEFELAAYWRTLRSEGYAFEVIREAVATYEHKDKSLYNVTVSFSRDEMALYSFVLLLCKDYESFLKTICEKNGQDIATLYNSIGMVYDDMGNYPKAQEYYLKALEIRKKVLGKEHPDTAKTYGNLAIIYSIRGNYLKAQEYYLKALEIHEKVMGLEHPDTATSYSNIGVFYYEMKDYPKALEYHLKALEIREIILGLEHIDTANSYNCIGAVYSGRGDYSHALKYYLKALEIQEKVLGKEHPRTAIYNNNIGNVYSGMKNYSKAFEYLFRAKEIFEKVLGKEHSDTAKLYISLGSVYNKTDDNPNAIKYLHKAMEIYNKVIGENSLDTADLYNILGALYFNMGDYPKVQEYYLKALKTLENVLGKEHSETAMFYNNLGVVCTYMNENQKALDYYMQALEIRKKVLGKEHSDTAQTYNNIGEVYADMGIYHNALDYYLKALKIREEVLGMEHLDTAQTINSIGLVNGKMGNYSETFGYLNKALEIREKILGEQHPDTAQSYNNIGTAYSNINNYTKSLENYFKALEIREKVLGKEHPDTATSYNNIGVVYSNMGDFDRALEYYMKGLEIREKVLGKEHPDTTQSYYNIGWTYVNMGDYPKALEYRFKMIEIKERMLGKEHPDTASSYSNVGEVFFKMGDYPQALGYYLKALEIREKVLGKDNSRIATLYNNIGELYRKLGDYQNALVYRQKELEYNLRNSGGAVWDTAVAYNNVGAEYRDLKQFDKAIEYITKAYEIAKKIGDDTPKAVFLNRLGRTYAAMGNVEEAHAKYLAAIDLLPEDHPEAIDSRERLESLKK